MPEANARQEFFFYLSDVLGRPVLSRDGEPVGRLHEIGCSSGDLYPRAVTYYIKPNRFSPLVLAVPAPAFDHFPDLPLRLTAPDAALQAVTRRTPEEILLGREILDKQIVDTDGARMVRVNDIHLLRARGNEIHVVHVDIGYRGILRRLGWERPLQALLGKLMPGRASLIDEYLLAWRHVVPLRAESLSQDLRLTVAQKQLSLLHPAELAEIMEEMDRFEGPAMLQALDVPIAARTLAELSPEMQRLLIEALDVRRAASLIAAMPPDEEADLLEELPEPLRERLIAALPAADAATVTDLLSQEPDTAGSVMNPEVHTAAAATTVGELVGELRRGTPEMSRPLGVAVIDEDSRLLGMVHLSDLVLVDPGTRLGDVMERDASTVRAEDAMRDVAELFDRFNLHVAAVVDEDNRFEGVVTVDDVVAWLREGADREGGLT